MTTSAGIEGHAISDEIALPDPPPSVVEAVARRDDRYAVHVVETLDDLLAHIHRLTRGARIGVVTDATVEALYGATLLRGLRERRSDVSVTVLPAGERSKSLTSARQLWDWLARIDLARRDVLLAFGGGVVCDVTGWVASAYMRGLPYVNVPTTLLGMVDGALGGKVAVNHPSAKNLLGAFYQPRGVVSDVGLLASLERRHIAAGLAEAIKKAMIASPAYLASIEADVETILRRQPPALRRLVAYASVIKTELVGRDPYERDLRRPLNFGHTVGHPLETVTGYGPLLHGEAVAFGMVVESEIARRRGLIADDDIERLVLILRRAGLPTTAGELPVAAGADGVIAAMAKVRQIRAGSLRWVLPCGIGRTLIADDVGEDEIRAALDACGIAA
jgi:3-dehydroquinate synthase